MRIDMPTCDFSYCRAYTDGNCHAIESRRGTCEYRIINKAFELSCKELTEELDSSLPFQMNRFEKKAVKELQNK